MEKNNPTLLNILNKEYGFPDTKAAAYKKVKQFFDEDKNQHVIYFELRLSRKEKPVARDSDYKKSQRLLYQIINAKKNT
ncbi:MAG: hypothetical protein OQK73_12685 [Gammaproteobacteria bacterium]|nr:hypothetical protein [Gammaproteobacteria bacterium]